MSLDLGQLVIMILRWSCGMAQAIGFAVLVAWVGDRCHQRWGAADRREAASTDTGATRTLRSDETAQPDHVPLSRH